MRTRPFAELVADIRADPEHRERIAQMSRAMKVALALAELRQEPGVTHIEHEEDPYLSTLRASVEALGGNLELRAVFPERTVMIVAGPKT